MVKFIKSEFITLICILFLNSCASYKNNFIDVNQILNDLEIGQLTVDKLNFPIENTFYLDTNISSKISLIMTPNIPEKKIDINDYVIDYNNRTIIKFKTKYKSLKTLLGKPNITLTKYFKKKYGIIDYWKNLDNNILIINNRAFVEIIDNNGICAFVLEQISPNEIGINLAYLIID